MRLTVFEDLLEIISSIGRLDSRQAVSLWDCIYYDSKTLGKKRKEKEKNVTFEFFPNGVFLELLNQPILKAV